MVKDDLRFYRQSNVSMAVVVRIHVLSDIVFHVGRFLFFSTINLALPPKSMLSI